MSNNLSQIIFDQFIDIVERLSHKACFEFNKCAFNYRTRESPNLHLIDVIYIAKDECDRCRDVVVTIDFTNICLEDLPCEKWINYLTKLAIEFIHDICPRKFVIVRNSPKKCRPQPAKWSPLPCKRTTTIIKRIKPIPKEPECEVIIEKECECVKKCIREPCIPKQQIIIRHESPKRSCCGDNLRLVESPKERKHQFKHHKGNIDYNHHEWKKCCHGMNRDDNSTNMH